MNGKKKRHVILIVLAVVALAAGILGGRELWLYEHPEIQIRFSHDRSEDLYRFVSHMLHSQQIPHRTGVCEAVW